MLLLVSVMRINAVQNTSLPSIANGNWCRQKRKYETEDPAVVKCQSGCMASWQELNGKVEQIQTQGCFTADSTTLFCAPSTCKSLHQQKLPRQHYSKYAKYATQNDTVTMHVCCCTGHLCNDNLRSFELEGLPTFTETATLHNLPPYVTSSKSVEEAPVTPWICAAVVIALVFAVAACFIKKCFWFAVKRRTDDDDESHTLEKISPYICSCVRRNRCANDKSRSSELESLSSANRSCGDERSSWTETIHDKDFDLHSSCLTIDWEKILGKGRFGTTYAARSITNENSKLYCYKDFLATCNECTSKNEIEINIVLAKFDHINAVTFYGQFRPGNRNGILLEYCSRGSLRNYLVDYTVNISLCLSFLFDLVTAITFLHSHDYAGQSKPVVVHRDIKSSNVFVRENLTLAIGDFGSAMSFGTSNDFANKEVQAQHLIAEGTPYYAAPEILDLSINLHNSVVSLKQSDIYSMSLVMWEIANRCHEFYENLQAVPLHKIPYQADVNDFSSLHELVVISGRRPTFGFSKKDTSMSEVASVLEKTIRECWDKDEDTRLTASCVKERLLFQMLDNDNFSLRNTTV